MRSREAICNGRRLSKIREEIVQKGSFSVDVGGRRLAAKDRAAPKANSTDQRTANANAIASHVSVAVARAPLRASSLTNSAALGNHLPTSAPNLKAEDQAAPISSREFG